FPAVLRHRQPRCPWADLPRSDPRAAPPARDAAALPAGDRGDVPLRAGRSDATDGRERLDLPSAADASREAAEIRGPRRGHRPLRPCVADLLHRGAHAARDLLRHLSRRRARVGRGDACSLGGREYRRGGQRADAPRLSRSRHGYLLHLGGDRKSTRLNSSHVKISYAVFCLKKKKKKKKKYNHIIKTSMTTTLHPLT